MVYITSELFGPNGNWHHPTPPTCTYTQAWNNMADSQPGNGKRKRRADDEEGTSLGKLAQRTSPHSKAIIRLHGHDQCHDTTTDTHKMYPVSLTASPRPVFDRRPLKQMRRSVAKLEKPPSHLMDIEPDCVPNSSDNTHRHAENNSDLRPCHSCNAAPKRKRDLENYMPCQRCGGRTCIICARQCWKCCTAICKKCIVEVGQDGDPECLECFEARINS